LGSDTLFRERTPTGEGILPSQEILDLVSTGRICGTPEISEDQIQPSSIDLRLSRLAYRVRASFLPGQNTTLETKVKSSGMLQETIDISGPTTLQPGLIYIIPLMESLDLPPDVYGIANPKSTTGRLDIFTRLITNHGDEFERVQKGYSGSLFIEVVSQTFPIIVKEGMRLNQLRFGRGRRGVVSDDRLKQLDQSNFLIDTDEDTGSPKIDRGMRLTVDLQGNGSDLVGYRAKRDLGQEYAIDLNRIGHYEVADYWEPIFRGAECILTPGEFYILASKQRVRIPPDLAAEMLPYDLATQEFRVHYAGFIDPGFGYGWNGEIPGTRVVLEVRANEMPILLEDDHFVGRLNYFNMSKKPDKIYGGLIGSSYQQQGLALAKQFKMGPQLSSSSRVDGSDRPQCEGKHENRKAAERDADDEDAGLLNLAFPTFGNESALMAKEQND
jgi:dCTP deaminase